jgi:hypothetical protein
MNEDEVDRACSTHGRDEKWIYNFSRHTRSDETVWKTCAWTSILLKRRKTISFCREQQLVKIKIMIVILSLIRSFILVNLDTLDVIHTGVGQNNGNTTDTVHISLLIWRWTTFAFNTAAVLLVMDSYKFWTVCNGILYHSSWRTFSSCFRDVGGGNLFLTVVSKTDQSGSVMRKSGEFGGRGYRLSWDFSWFSWVPPPKTCRDSVTIGPRVLLCKYFPVCYSLTNPLHKCQLVK